MQHVCVRAYDAYGVCLCMCVRMLHMGCVCVCVYVRYVSGVYECFIVCGMCLELIKINSYLRL
jgi:hypothetical protein